jgi:hypothetical protein
MVVLQKGFASLATFKLNADTSYSLSISWLYLLSLKGFGFKIIKSSLSSLSYVVLLLQTLHIIF